VQSVISLQEQIYILKCYYHCVCKV